MSAVHLLVLAPTDHPVRVVPGARTITADCGHEAWIAPTGIRLLVDTPSTKTCCLRCTPDTPPTEMRVPPGARDELTRRDGVAHADQIMAFIHEYNRQQKR